MDMGLLCCFKKVIKDVKPRTLDPRNIYQKFKIHRHHDDPRHSFFAKSLAPYGYPPKLLRNKGWVLRISSRPSKKLQVISINDALGLDTSLRTQLPRFDFPMSSKASPSAIVGTWYCPFVFIREGSMRIRKQMKRSLLYKMSLEQYWEEIYSCENLNDEINSMVIIDTDVQREVDLVFGMEGVKDNRIGHGGFIWYRSIANRNSGRRFSVGLSFAVVEKMKWVLETGGWFDGPERSVRIERRVEIRRDQSSGLWRRLCCYVLVESFMLRRMDGSLVLKCNFRHTDKIKCKCE